MPDQHGRVTVSRRFVMNKLKKIVAGAAAAITVSAVGVVGFAETASTYSTSSYPTYDFINQPVSIEAWSSKWVGHGEKTDDEDYAAVHTTTGNLSSTTYVSFAIFTPSDEIVSDFTTAKSNNARCTMDYTVHRGTGSSNWLRGYSGRYKVTFSGYWTP